MSTDTKLSIATLITVATLLVAGGIAWGSHGTKLETQGEAIDKVEASVEGLRVHVQTEVQALREERERARKQVVELRILGEVLKEAVDDLKEEIHAHP